MGNPSCTSAVWEVCSVPTSVRSWSTSKQSRSRQSYLAQRTRIALHLHPDSKPHTRQTSGRTNKSIDRPNDTHTHIHTYTPPTDTHPSCRHPIEPKLNRLAGSTSSTSYCCTSIDHSLIIDSAPLLVPLPMSPIRLGPLNCLCLRIANQTVPTFSALPRAS